MKTLLLGLALLGPIDAMDGWVHERLVETRSPVLDGTMRAATRIGTPVVVLGALLGIAIFDPVHGVVLARTALAALVPTNLAVEGLKRLTQRHRPSGEHNRANSSFPSSHAANAAALAMVLAHRWRRLALVFGLAAALVCVSRVYLGRHYLSDVLAGAVIGVASAWWAIAWMRRRSAAAKQERGQAARSL